MSRYLTLKRGTAMTSFGEQLIAARKAKGYTQEQLAEKLLVSRTTISRWESGKIMPDIDTIKLLSKELDFNFFTVDDILTETSASAIQAVWSRLWRID